MWDEIYRYTVLRDSRGASKNAVDPPKPNSEHLKPVDDDQPDWSLERISDNNFLTNLLAHTSSPPSSTDLELLVHTFALDTVSNEPTQSNLLRLLDSEPGQQLQGGLGALFNSAIKGMPDSDSELNRIVDAIILTDTLRSHLRKKMTPEEWVSSTRRYVRWSPSDNASDQTTQGSSTTELSRFIDIGQTFVAINQIDSCQDVGEAIQVVMGTPLADEIFPLLREHGTGHVRNYLNSEGHSLALNLGVVKFAPSTNPNFGLTTILGSAAIVPAQNTLVRNDSTTNQWSSWHEPFAQGSSNQEVLKSVLESGLLELYQQNRTPSKIAAVGRQELIVVRKRHLGYRLAELSHIENVAPFETRERTHQIETEVSTLEFRETENEQETQEDLATTTRDELRREIQKKTREQFELSGKVRVSNRGPGFKIDAEASASFQRETEQSSNSVRDHAVEVVEEASTRIRERTLNRSERQFRRLVRESNRHSFDNNLPNGSSSQYYWLQKVERVALYNYGDRMMYEIVVPDPSAHLRALSTIAPDKQSLTRPPPTVYYDSLFQTEEPLDIINEWDSGTISAKFNLPELVEPEQVLWIQGTVKDQKGDDDNDSSSMEGTLTIPEGREATSLKLTVQTHKNGHGDMPAVSIVVGDIQFWVNADTLDRMSRKDNDPGRNRVGMWSFKLPETDEWIKPFPVGNRSEDYGPNIPGSFQWIFELDASSQPSVLGGPVFKLPKALPVGAHKYTVLADDYSRLSVNVTLETRLSEAGAAKWRRDLTSAVVNDYWIQYETYMATQVGTTTSQDEPLENLSDAQAAELREIELDEVKRAVIAIIRNQDPVGVGALTDNAMPDVAGWYSSNRDFNDELVFLEQAFEWQHMDFMLYGYYWSEAKNWPVKIFGQQGGDRAFREFLKAGAARVRLPVREGFAHLVEEYISKLKWPRQPPRIGSPGYVDFVTEKTERLGRPGNEVPVCEPTSDSADEYQPVYWDVATPTDLVMLRTWATSENIPLERWVPPSNADMLVDDPNRCPDPLTGWSMTGGVVPDDPSQNSP